MKGSFLSQSVHSRGFAVMLIILAVGCSLLSLTADTIPMITGNKGLVLPSPNNWIGPGLGSFMLSVAVNLAVAMLAVYINRAYNVMRSLTMLFAGLFFVMQAATPSLFTQFYGGIVLALVVEVCTAMLFAIYGSPQSTRNVFLIFFLVAVTALWQYAALFYIPLLLLGCVQTRILNLRTLLAAVIGIVTPLWIGLGLGLLTVDDFHWPDFVSYFSAMNGREVLPIVVTVGFTAVIGVMFTLFNLIRVLSYNSRTRAYNGFLALTLFATVALVVFDFADVAVYVPLLNCCTAFQIGHFFSVRRAKRSYLGVLAVIAIYASLYLWNLWS